MSIENGLNTLASELEIGFMYKIDGSADIIHLGIPNNGDRYGTCVDIDAKNSIIIPIDANLDTTDFDWTPISFRVITHGSSIYVSPKYFSQKVRSEKLGIRTSLKNDCTFYPNYVGRLDNEAVQRIPDSVTIKAGASAILSEGGQIGNIKVEILDGEMIVRCHTDRAIGNQLEVVDQNHALYKKLTQTA